MNNFQFWKDIWQEKGKSDKEDLLFLDGYDHLNINFSSKEICDKIIKIMNIKNKDMVLEVGCGAGFLSQNMRGNYFGVDYCDGLLKKNKKFFNKLVLSCEANSLPFEENSFNKVYAYGVFQYFPSLEYSKKVIEEMKRVSKESVFIGDLKTFGNKEHMFYSKSFFGDWEISPCFYDVKNEQRFNAYLDLK